jgi:hypothetical protein
VTASPASHPPQPAVSRSYPQPPQLSTAKLRAPKMSPPADRLDQGRPPGGRGWVPPVRRSKSAGQRGRGGQLDSLARPDLGPQDPVGPGDRRPRAGPEDSASTFACRDSDAVLARSSLRSTGTYTAHHNPTQDGTQCEPARREGTPAPWRTKVPFARTRRQKLSTPPADQAFCRPRPVDWHQGGPQGGRALGPCKRRHESPFRSRSSAPSGDSYPHPPADQRFCRHRRIDWHQGGPREGGPWVPVRGRHESPFRSCSSVLARESCPQPPADQAFCRHYPVDWHQGGPQGGWALGPCKRRHESPFRSHSSAPSGESCPQPPTDQRFCRHRRVDWRGGVPPGTGRGLPAQPSASPLIKKQRARSWQHRETAGSGT